MEILEIDSGTCRTCLSNNSEILDLESVMENTTSDKTYKQILEELIQIQFTEEQEINLPQHICFICCQQIQYAYEFIKQAQESYDELIKLFTSAKFNDECFVEHCIDVPVDGECEAESIDVPVNEECHTESIIKSDEFEDLVGTKTPQTFLDTEEIEEVIELVDMKIADDQFLEIDEIPVDIEDDFIVVETSTNSNIKHEESNEYSENEHKLITSQEEEDKVRESSNKDENEITNADNVITLQCTYCDYVTGFQHLMDYHINSKHKNDENLIQCHFCGSTFSRKYCLLIHMQNNHKQAVKDLKVEMDFKGKKSTTSMEENDNYFLYYLLNIQKRSLETEPLNCKRCDYSALTKRALDYHYRYKHGIDKNKYKCRFCEKSYTRKWDLAKHMKNNHTEDVNVEKKNISSRNERRYETRNSDLSSGLVKNERNALPELNQENNEFKCKFCGDSYLLKFDLLRHLKIHIKNDVNNLKKEGSEEQNDEEESELKVFLDQLSVNNEEECAEFESEENDDLLIIQQDSNDGTVQWLCKYCDHAAKSKRALDFHQRQKHPGINEENKFKCKFCENSYTRKHGLLLHIRGSHMEDVNRLKNEMNSQGKSAQKDEVPAEDDTDDFIHDLLNMQKRSLDTETQMCQYCDFTTATKRSMEYHLRSEHGINENDFKCVFCENSYTRKYGLYIHIKTNHKKDIRRLRKKKAEEDKGVAVEDDVPPTDFIKSKDYADCDDISQTNDFDDEDDTFLQSLLNIQKKSPMLRYLSSLPRSCDICGKIYANANGLQSHKRLMHDSEIQRRFECSYCSKHFKRLCDLKGHVASKHSETKLPPKKRKRPPQNELKYLCSYCSYCCTTITSLNIHIRRHHTNERPFQCDLCDKSFLIPLHLKTHRYLHTGERPFKCPYCQKGFRDNAQMKKHKRTHSNERPYKCIECDKGFTRSYSLSLHNRTRHPLLILSCNVCNKRFNDSASLNLHRINEDHPDEVDIL